MATPYEDVFAALNRAECEYVVVGGVAVTMHGHARFTADIDLAIALTEQNALRVITVLEVLGLRPRIPVPALDFVDSRKREIWVAEKNMLVFSMYHPASAILSVDLFVRNDPPFAQLAERAQQMKLGDVKIAVASIDDLIVMKTAASRPIDLEDIEKLQQIKQLRQPEAD